MRIDAKSDMRDVGCVHLCDSRLSFAAKRYRYGWISISAMFCILALMACNGFVERTVTVGNCTISFYEGGGADVEDIETAPWATIVLPTSARDGYTFEGWYSTPASEGGGARIGGAGDPVTVNGCAAMYARWVMDLPVDEGDSVISGIAVVRVRVGAGTFTMGSPLSEADRYFDETQREVTLTRDFWIGKYPITNAQLGRAVPVGEEDHPAVNVSWFEALAYAQSKGGTLPTEAQWEFAARGGNEGKDHRHIYSGGDDLYAVGWFAGNSEGGTRAVGQKSPNELGIYDMSGNVYEWVNDWYGYNDDHGGEPVTDPTGPDTGYGRIHRGGGWNAPARDCRVADRAYSHPSFSSGYVGFRVAFPAGD